MSSEADWSFPAGWPLALALGLTIVAAVATGVADAFDVPLAVGVSAPALFIAGVLVAFGSLTPARR